MVYAETHLQMEDWDNNLQIHPLRRAGNLHAIYGHSLLLLHPVTGSREAYLIKNISQPMGYRHLLLALLRYVHPNLIAS